MKTYSTKQAARIIGIHPVTLLTWTRLGKFRPRKKLEAGGVRVWIWDERDIARLKAFKEQNYWRKRIELPQRSRMN